VPIQKWEGIIGIPGPASVLSYQLLEWCCCSGLRETFELHQAKIRPSTTSTGFSSGIGRLQTCCHSFGPAKILFFFFFSFLQVLANLFFIVMPTGQELGHWWVSQFSDVVKLWNATTKKMFRLFAIHQTATSLQRTDNLNPRTGWYPALDEINWMKYAYFTIHPGKNSPPQNGFRSNSIFFSLKALVSNPPLSEFNRSFHKTIRLPLH